MANIRGGGMRAIELGRFMAGFIGHYGHSRGPKARELPPISSNFIFLRIRTGGNRENRVGPSFSVFSVASCLMQKRDTCNYLALDRPTIL